MSLVDWRRLLDVDPHNPDAGMIALDVVDAGAAVPAAFRSRLALQLVLEQTAEAGREGPLPPAPRVDLDLFALGELIDQLREAAGVLLALQGSGVAAAAVVGLDVTRDTPGTHLPLSEGPGSIRDRG